MLQSLPVFSLGAVDSPDQFPAQSLTSSVIQLFGDFKRELRCGYSRAVFVLVTKFVATATERQRKFWCHQFRLGAKQGCAFIVGRGGDKCRSKSIIRRGLCRLR